MPKSKILILLLILPLFLSSNFTWGQMQNYPYQQSFGTLNVYVTDKNNQPLPQITVSIIKDNSLLQELHTDNNGQATIQLPPGTYNIEINDPSNIYTSSKIDSVEIIANQETNLKITLDVLVSQPSPSSQQMTQTTSTEQMPTKVSTSTLNILVRDEINNPLKNITVKYTTLISVSADIIEDSKITDENGTVRFVLVEGKYKISAFDPNQQYIFEEESKEIYIPAGVVINLEIQLKKKSVQIPKIKIGGKVLLNGQEIREALVYLKSEKGEIQETKTDEKGNFNFEILPNQELILDAQKVIDNTLYKSEVRELQVKQEDLSLNLNLEKFKSLFKEVKITFTPQEKKEIILEDKVKIEIPEFVVTSTQSLNVNLKPAIELPLQKNVFLLTNVYEMQIFDEKNQEIKRLEKEIKIEIPYDEEFLKQKNIKENNLKIAYFDENKQVWIPLAKSFVDTQKKVVVGFVSHLTKFAIIAFADIIPPQPPTEVKLKFLPGPKVKISWKNPQEDFRHINIYRSERKNVIGNLIFQEITTTTVIDENVKMGKTYYYLLKAVDYAGNVSLNTEQYPVTLKQLKNFLKKGARGNDVKILQEILVKEKLLSPDLITGYFGPLTFRAVIKFQEKYKDEILKPWDLSKGTGFVGPTTLKKINQLLEISE